MASVNMAKSFGKSIMENLMYFQPNEMALWLRLVPQLELTGTSSNPGMVIYVLFITRLSSIVNIFSVCMKNVK